MATKATRRRMRKTSRRSFSTGMGGGRPGMGKKGNLGKISDHIKKGSAFIRTFGEYDDIADGLNTAAAVLDTADQLHNDYVRPLKTGFDTKSKSKIGLTYNPSDHTSANEPIVPAFVSNSEKKHSLANNSDDRIVYKTVFNTGKKPSSSVLTAKKQNGSGYRVLADSMIELATVAERNILTQFCGFNQKLYHIPPIAAQVPLYLVKDLIANDASDAQESLSGRRILSNVLNIKQQFMIKNTSAHFPMKFTIHLVKIDNSEYATNSFNSVFSRMFYGAGDDLSDFGNLKTGFVPKYLQHLLLDIEGSDKTQSANVLVSNKLRSLDIASNFRQACKVVETFTKTIEPGDYWNFSHVHHCGSGIDLTSIFRATDDGAGEGSDIAFGLERDQNNMPFTMGVIFECKGQTAEAYEIPELNAVNTYLGSAPVTYSYEYKTAAYFAAEGTDTLNVNTPSTRIYEQDTFISSFGTNSTVREKFIPPANIRGTNLAPSNVANVGLAYFPMLTSTGATNILNPGINEPG